MFSLHFCNYLWPLYPTSNQLTGEKNKFQSPFFSDWWWILWLAVRQKTKVSHMCTWTMEHGTRGVYRDEGGQGFHFSAAAVVLSPQLQQELESRSHCWHHRERDEIRRHCGVVFCPGSALIWPFGLQLPQFVVSNRRHHHHQPHRWVENGRAGVKDNWRQHVRHRSGSRHVYSLGLAQKRFSTFFFWPEMYIFAKLRRRFAVGAFVIGGVGSGPVTSESIHPFIPGVAFSPCSPVNKCGWFYFSPLSLLGHVCVPRFND